MRLRRRYVPYIEQKSRFEKVVDTAIVVLFVVMVLFVAAAIALQVMDDMRR